MVSKRYAFISGASAGIGQALAREIHSQGYDLTVCARRESRLRQLQEELNQQRDNSCHVLVADLTSSTSDNGGRKQVEKYLRDNHFDLLINNAGFGRYGLFHSGSIEGDESMVALNCVTPICLTYAVLPQMLERKSGGVINVSSIAGYQPIPLMSTYAASKAFLTSHTYALNAEYRKHGIYFMALCPGPVPTEFGEVSGFDSNAPLYSISPEQVARSAVIDFERGKLISIPGRSAKIMSYFSRALPKRLSSWLIQKTL